MHSEDESTIVDANLFKTTIIPKSNLPQLEKMFKKKEIGKKLVNDVLHNMVSNRKREHSINLEKMRSSTKHGTKRHSTKYSSTISRRGDTKKVEISSAEGTEALMEYLGAPVQQNPFTNEVIKTFEPPRGKTPT